MEHEQDTKKEYILSRLLITGRLSLDTPSCVLVEIASAHGISLDQARLPIKNYRNQVIDLIHKTDCRILRCPFSRKDYTYLARYINPNPEIRWKCQDLEKAFKFLSRFEFHHPLSSKLISSLNGINYGLQTPNCITSINCCL